MSKAEQLWNKKAKTYPRYTEDPNTFEADTLRVIDSLGVSYDGLNILDVGCGSGRYTIHLAKKAKSVTATDFSAEMLKILNEDAAKAGIANISTVHTSWADFDLGEREIDVVFCSTTPAVREIREYKRIYDIASKFVIYVGWAGRKDSEIMNPLYEKYGIPFQKPDGSKHVKEWLTGEKIPFRSHLLDDIWLRTFEYEEMKGYCMETLKDCDFNDYKEEDIEEVIKPHIQPDGTVLEKVYARLELTIWEKQPV